MDTRTGQMYESKQAALDAGVPEEFLVEVAHAHATPRVTREPYQAPQNPKHERHQGSRETARRQRQHQATSEAA